MVNGIGYKPEHLTGWRIFTLDANNFRVDGTKDTVPGQRLIGSSVPETSSFGMYQNDINSADSIRIRVQVDALLPYSLQEKRQYVTVKPFQVPTSCTSNLRILAPEGFEWAFEDAEFRSISRLEDPAVSADWPGAAPKRVGNALIWDEAIAWNSDDSYGFRALIRVPDRSPTSSPNEFRFELGYDGTSISNRYAASSVPCPLVQALVNGNLEYVTNVESKENDLIFQLETITDVPAGGGFFFTGPAGFTMNKCDLEVAPAERGSVYQVAPMQRRVRMLPNDVTCDFVPSANQTTFKITAGIAGIKSGLYRFMIHARNPAGITPNLDDDSTQCGKEFCWSLRSIQSMALGALAPDLDAPVFVPAFSINTKIVQASLEKLSPAQQAATHRDDRPLRRNPLVFAFSLFSNAIQPTIMLIRGPLGTIFREDCGQDVEVRSDQVFGLNQALPAGYTVWPDGVVATSCRGEGSDARIMIDPGISDGLRAENVYAIRVAVLQNPQTQPVDNMWTFDFNRESSDPFPGYQLWTFTRTSLSTVCYGTSTAVTGTSYLKNPVTITFRPYKTVSGAGMMIQVLAPPNFQIAHENLICKIFVQPVYTDPAGYTYADPNTAPPPNYVGPPSLIWGDADVQCTVDALTLRNLTAVVLASARALTGGVDYQITLFVRNPAIQVSVAAWNVWTLETFDSPQMSGVLPTFRDSVTIAGYPVYPEAVQWFYRNQDPSTGLPATNGLSRIPSLFFQMQFPRKIMTGDAITIHAPAGFYFESESGSYSCKNFRWEPPTESMSYLPNSNISCSGNVMMFQVNEPKSVPEQRLISFSVDCINPASTPHVMQNYWVVQHQQGETILANDAVLSWNVVPQLKDVRVELVGKLKAQGSTSSMAISFMPVSDADELEFKVKAPGGFDFTGASATSLGHEVIATNVETIRIRASIYTAVKVNIVITKFKLGVPGGDTFFDLITRLNNGDQKDQALSFKGFRLPGSVIVSQPVIQSMYALNPGLYPVASLWQVRMGESAKVQFPFTLTMTANDRTFLRLRAPPYTLYADNFQIIRSGSSEIISAEVISASAGELVARLSMILFSMQMYQVTVKVVTPSVPNPTDAMWTVEILDGADLPLNTNDGLTQGFRLVGKVDLKVRTLRAPPLAVVQALVSFDPQSTNPDQLILVAPSGFNFTSNCLINGGPNNEVLSCTIIGDIAGRAAAKLTTVRLSGPVEGFVLGVTTPPQSPSNPGWYVDSRDSTTGLQLGWGEDSEGITVRQMAGASVMFAGIPLYSGQMAFRFVMDNKLDTGGKLRIGYPKSITILCEGDYRKPISIGSISKCINNEKQGYFELLLSAPLPPGQQAFAVTSTCPASVQDNTFYIVVFTSTGEVQDAAMSIPGRRIQQGLPVKALDLIWGTAEPNRATFVSAGFQLLDDLPLKDPPIMSEVIVQLPPDFKQQVTRPAQVETMSQPIPYADNWLDATNPTRLRLLLDGAQTAYLQQGKYRFQFPILVPARMPAYNVWLITICSPTATNATCSGPDDPRALVTFPLAGFAMGQVSHDSSVAFATGGCPEIRMPFWTLVFALALLTNFVHW